MIAFASLFIGIIIGIHPVNLLVGDSVAYVEVVLNDRTVGYLGGEPWSLEINFGAELRPHELVAVGYDAERKEVIRAQQRVNLPRQPAETAIFLRGGKNGRGVTASLVWNSVVDEQPRSITVSVDGQPLAVSDPTSISLPDYDPEQLHFMRAEIDFSDTLSSRSEITFGGAYAEHVSTELTAVSVHLGDAIELVGPESLNGVSRNNSQPLSIVAVEKGPAELLIILDEGAREALRRVGRISSQDLETLKEREEMKKSSDGRLRVSPGNLSKNFRVGSAREVASSSLRKRMVLGPDLRLQFLSPFSKQQVQTGTGMGVFPPSRVFTANDGGFYWVLMQAQPADQNAGRQRLADAVAAGSFLVTRRNRRRAVLLILGDDPKDESVLAPLQVRRFLANLRIPLFTWSIGSGADPVTREWKSVTVISSLGDLDRAVKQLFDQLNRQRIVWIDGVHLPQDIVINFADTEFSLVQ